MLTSRTTRFVTQRISELNAFGSSRTTLEDHRKERVARDLLRIRFGSSGIWPVASRMNHSCYVSCQRSYIGDMQIVRAARDLPAGAELLIDYRSPLPYQTYEEVQDMLFGYGFTCACDICAIRKAMCPKAFDELKDLQNELQEMLFGDRAPDAYHVAAVQRVDMKRAEGILERMVSKFPPGPVRLELCEPFTVIGGSMLGHHRPVDAIRLIVRGLRLVGFEVTATVLPRAEFRITRWGYVPEHIPMALMTLFGAYRCLGATAACDEIRRYARVAYSIHMGEGHTMEEEYTEFAHPY